MTTPVLIVHGGAWTIPEHLLRPCSLGTRKAARAGYAVLMRGGSAIDAVQAAVCELEDDPAFDAGNGSVLTSKGEVEMDAVIMDGKTLKSGAVACVHNIKNPILLARAVMDKTAHVLLVSKGANQFAEEIGMETVPTETLVSEEAVRELEVYKENYGSTVHDLFCQRHKTEKGPTNSGHDTVGALALDSAGNVAFGTSTGGITAKKPGRVGDSPIMGAGGYADNEIGAVSCTGHGESIFKVCLASSISNLMKLGLGPQAAAEKALDGMARRVDGYGGVIVVSADGDVAKSFTTEHMSWAYVKHDVLHHGLDVGDDFTEPWDANDVTNGIQNGTNGINGTNGTN